jgi:hypothetical protein
MTPTIEALKNTINEKELEIQVLKDELISEIKNAVSFDIDVNVNEWCTYIATSPNGNRNQFTIYHDNYNGKPKFEISWFSSTLNLSNDRYEYSEYLIVLGKAISAMKNGLQDVFETYLKKIKVLYGEISKMGWEIKRETTEIEFNQVKDNIKGNLGSIKMNTNVFYRKSTRTNIEYNQIGWVKSKKGYDVYFKLDETFESKKITFDEVSFINYLNQVKYLVLEFN